MPKKTRDVIVASSDWTVPTADGVHRRTIVKGAAWTVPVVAVAMATPAAAASEAFVCPTVPASTGWTGASGITGSTAGGGYYRWSDDKTEWVNTKDATQTSSLSYYIEFSFKGVAGHTYNFNWSAYANGAANNVSYVAYDVAIGGTKIYSASTDGNAGTTGYLDPNTGTTTTASHSFTPTTDGTYTFRYTVRLSQLTANQIANHNVVIKMPTLTCS